METGEVANPIFARSDANDTVVVPKLPAGTGVNVYQAAVVLPFVTFFFVAARFYARFIVLRRKPTIDDCRSTCACHHLDTGYQLTQTRRYCLFDISRHHRVFGDHRYRHLQWHGFTCVAIHAGAQLEVLPLVGDIVGILLSRSCWFQECPDPPLPSNIRSREPKFPHRLLSHAFLHHIVPVGQFIDAVSRLHTRGEILAPGPSWPLHQQDGGEHILRRRTCD